jgi:FKBP-type peptidyl-prolyl cis-trans isomerase FkpA
MNRKPLLLAVSAVALSLAVPAGYAAGPELKTEQDKTFYALGVLINRNMAPFHMTPAEWEIVKSGIEDAMNNRPPKVELEAYGPKINELGKTRQGEVNKKASVEEKKAGAAYQEKAAKEKGAIKKPSGLIYKEIVAGKGASPKATDKVKVHYHGTLIDGTVFDSSVERKQPIDFALNGVIPCWTEGVQMMKVGGKARLVCPSEIAYGDNGAPPKIKPGATLVFDVELLDIVK